MSSRSIVQTVENQYSLNHLPDGQLRPADFLYYHQIDFQRIKKDLRNFAHSSRKQLNHNNDSDFHSIPLEFCKLHFTVSNLKLDLNLIIHKNRTSQQYVDDYPTFILFALPSELALLQRAHWCIDGTFKA